MASIFRSFRSAAAAAGLALGSTAALAAPIDFSLPNITFTWPPSAPDALLIGSGVVVILALAFALTRRHARKPPPVAQGPDLRWWKNPD